MKTISFKSTPANYTKEFLGLKRNTIRKFDMDDDREVILRAFMGGAIDELYVEIEHTETQEIFNRKVTDVTFWEGFYIISW